MNKQNFWAEFLLRVTKKNPRFFDLIQVAAAIVAGASVTLQMIYPNPAMAPNAVAWLDSSSAWISGVVAIVIAQLPNKDVNEPVAPQPPLKS